MRLLRHHIIHMRLFAIIHATGAGTHVATATLHTVIYRRLYTTEIRFRKAEGTFPAYTWKPRHWWGREVGAWYRRIPT